MVFKKEAEILIFGHKLFGNKPIEKVKIAEKILEKNIEPIGLRDALCIDPIENEWDIYQECFICNKEIKDESIEEHMKKEHNIEKLVWLYGKCYNAKDFE